MQRQMVTLDYQKRKQLYDRVQQLIAENLPFIFLATPNVLSGAKSQVGNFHPAVLDHYTLWNADQLYCARNPRAWKEPASVSGTAAKLQHEGCASWTDERLVAECLNGTEQAWSALIDKYKNLIYSIPIKLGMHDDAADIFQAVCLDLLSDLPKLREPRALPKWLIADLLSQCLQYKRKADKHQSLTDDHGEELSPCGQTDSASGQYPRRT